MGRRRAESDEVYVLDLRGQLLKGRGTAFCLDFRATVTMQVISTTRDLFQSYPRLMNGEIKSVDLSLNQYVSDRYILSGKNISSVNDQFSVVGYNFIVDLVVICSDENCVV